MIRCLSPESESSQYICTPSSHTESESSQYLAIVRAHLRLALCKNSEQKDSKELAIKTDEIHVGDSGRVRNFNARVETTSITKSMSLIFTQNATNLWFNQIHAFIRQIRWPFHWFPSCFRDQLLLIANVGKDEWVCCHFGLRLDDSQLVFLVLSSFPSSSTLNLLEQQKSCWWITWNDCL